MTDQIQAIRMPVVIGFNPADHPEIAEVFRNEAARTLYLLWRVGHIVGEGFCGYVLDVGGKILAQKPRTVEELVGCFPLGGQLHSYWRAGDVRRFCERALPYFTGERACTYAMTTAHCASYQPGPVKDTTPEVE